MSAICHKGSSINPYIWWECGAPTVEHATDADEASRDWRHVNCPGCIAAHTSRLRAEIEQLESQKAEGGAS